MRIRNVVHCRSLLSKMLGLMFHPRTDKKYIFDFRREIQIDLHMLFVFYPLYAYFLDDKKRVVEKIYMKPFRFYSSKKKARYCIESMRDLKLKIGKRVEF